MVKIDYRDGRPIYEQVSDGIEQLVLHGVLPAGAQIPSVRQLATELSINPNTIQRAYSDLEKKGVIYSAKGKGNFVSDDFSILREQKIEKIEKQMKSLAKEAYLLGAVEEQIKGWVSAKGVENT